jgi:hypothetical protein
MNERIRELRAKAVMPIQKDGYTSWVFSEEKFAELIVRECIEHLEGNVLVPNIEHSQTKTKCIRSIKEHFGVEE